MPFFKKDDGRVYWRKEAHNLDDLVWNRDTSEWMKYNDDALTWTNIAFPHPLPVSWVSEAANTPSEINNLNVTLWTDSDWSKLWFILPGQEAPVGSSPGNLLDQAQPTVTLAAEPTFPPPPQGMATATGENWWTLEEVEASSKEMYAKFFTSSKDDDMKLPPQSVFPYNMNSKGAQLLAEALGFPKATRNVTVANPDGSVDVKTYDIVNWGATKLPPSGDASFRVLNKVTPVQTASNRLKFYERIKGKAPIPEYTTDLQEALRWIQDGKLVLGRSSRSKHGTDILPSGGESDLIDFSNSEYFTVYRKKTAEFRVHIAFGDVLDVSSREPRTEDHNGTPINPKDLDFRFRTGHYGFRMVPFKGTVPTQVIEAALAAFEASGLDFGAVDVLWNSTNKNVMVMEMNTAPGIDEALAKKYASAIKPHLGG